MFYHAYWKLCFMTSLWRHELYVCTYKVQKRWRHKNFFWDFNVLDTMYRWSMTKSIHSLNWVGICFPSSYEPGQFTLISMGLIRYSCGHISGYHEPIHVNFFVWGFLIMFFWNIVMKMLKCKKENLMTSHFSTLFWYVWKEENYDIDILWYQLGIPTGLVFNHPINKPCYRKKAW